MTAVPITVLLLEMPPSAVGSRLTPAVPHVLVTVTVICVPVGNPVRLDGLVVTVYAELGNPALLIEVLTAAWTLVAVALGRIAALAP
jgi:hypothetical protein